MTAAGTELAAFVASAWQHGVGPDDRDQLAALAPVLAAAPSADDPAELTEARVFAALARLIAGYSTEAPAPPPGLAGRVLHAAARVTDARLAHAAAPLGLALDELDRALERLDPRDPRGPAARAWADLTLGDVATELRDSPRARRRYEAVTDAANPAALRIVAMLRLVGLTMSRLDVAPARRWARRAVTLAVSAKRREQELAARLTLGLLEYMGGDSAGMRTQLEPLLGVPETANLARLLLAGVEQPSIAMPLLADGLRLATERDDYAQYLLCVLIGARRYASIGKLPDALVTLTAGIHHLKQVAEPLAAPLVEERAAWRAAWGEPEYARIEQEALDLLADA